MNCLDSQLKQFVHFQCLYEHKLIGDALCLGIKSVTVLEVFHILYIFLPLEVCFSLVFALHNNIQYTIL